MIEYKNKWLISYETLCFNTIDGDLDVDQYVEDEIGEGYYIRTISKSESQFDRVKKPYNTSKLKKVKIIAGKHCYYDEFRDAKGKTVRIQSTAEKYNGLRYIKDYPQPIRTEMVETIPIFPEDFLSEQSEHHSIGFDATSNSGAKGGVSSYSWSHTCGTGDNRLLVAGDSHDCSPDITVSSITYNSVEMTSIRSDVAAYSANPRSTIYYLLSPDSGAKTIAVTLSGTVWACVGGTISYTGVAQSGQPDAHNGATGTTGTTQSVSVTTVADNCWVVSVTEILTTSVTCGNTQRWNVLHDYNSCTAGGSDTNGPKTPAGTQVMSWTSLANTNWAISAASFAPYVAIYIHNIYELQAIEDDLAANYILANDIDASPTNPNSENWDEDEWPGTEGFRPIGSDDPYFTGNLDGQNHVITGLYINRPDGDPYWGVGLFTDVESGSVIQNVCLIDVNITGYDYVAGLAGWNAGNITNCNSTGIINGHGRCSGLIGENDGTITNCYNETMINCTGNYIGGLVGMNGWPIGTILNCYNNGIVSSTGYYVGGLVGWNISGEGILIDNCYNTGSISGNQMVGGLIGRNENGLVRNSYSTGIVNGGIYYVGGLVGRNNDVVINCFWDTQTSGQATSEGGTGKTTAEMKDDATFTDLETEGLDTPWDFVGNPHDDVGIEDYWDINLTFNNGYPYLTWQEIPPSEINTIMFGTNF